MQRATLTICIKLFFLLVLCGPPAHAETSRLVIQTAKHKEIRFEVEVARTESQLQQGLMYRRSLAPGHGMLFVFPHKKIATFWMKNTYIPLDLIFFDATGKIVSLHENLKPESLEYVSSADYTLAALEVPAGTIKKYGFTTNDRLLEPKLK